MRMLARVAVACPSMPAAMPWSLNFVASLLLGVPCVADKGAVVPPAPPPLLAGLYPCPACCDHGFELEFKPSFTNTSGTFHCRFRLLYPADAW